MIRRASLKSGLKSGRTQFHNEYGEPGAREAYIYVWNYEGHVFTGSIRHSVLVFCGTCSPILVAGRDVFFVRTQKIKEPAVIQIRLATACIVGASICVNDPGTLYFQSLAVALA